MTLPTHPADAADKALIRHERDGEVLHLRLNRPGKRNAVNDALLQRLEGLLTRLDPEGRCAVLSGEGMHFCAGLDLWELAEHGAYYRLPEGQRGIFVGGGGSMRLPRPIGAARMADMMLTGRVLDAAQGQQAGLTP